MPPTRNRRIQQTNPTMANRRDRHQNLLFPLSVFETFVKYLYVVNSRVFTCFQSLNLSVLSTLVQICLNAVLYLGLVHPVQGVYIRSSHSGHNNGAFWLSFLILGQHKPSSTAQHQRILYFLVKCFSNSSRAAEWMLTFSYGRDSLSLNPEHKWHCNSTGKASPCNRTAFLKVLLDLLFTSKSGNKSKKHQKNMRLIALPWQPMTSKGTPSFKYYTKTVLSMTHVAEIHLWSVTNRACENQMRVEPTSNCYTVLLILRELWG